MKVTITERFLLSSVFWRPRLMRCACGSLPTLEHHTYKPDAYDTMDPRQDQFIYSCDRCESVNGSYSNNEKAARYRWNAVMLIHKAKEIETGRTVFLKMKKHLP